MLSPREKSLDFSALPRRDTFCGLFISFPGGQGMSFQEQISSFIVSMAFGGEANSNLLAYLSVSFLEIIILVLNTNKTL